MVEEIIKFCNVIMIKRLIIFLLILIGGIFIIDLSTMVYTFIIYLMGNIIISMLNRDSRAISLQIFQVLFMGAMLYMYACYIYMVSHGYKYLLAIDVYAFFMPAIERYLMLGDYSSMLKEIWVNYDFFSRFHFGFYTYSMPFAILSKSLEANLYVSMQLSVLVLYAFSGVLIFKLFRKSNFIERKSLSYTYVISFLSIIFFYSSIYLRDIHIMLLYLSGIYLTFNRKFSFTILLKIFAIILITTTFRIESGLFLFLLIPVYLILTMQSSRYKVFVIVLSFVFAAAGLFLYVSVEDKLSSVYEANQEAYVEDISQGEGVIGMLQRVPVAGDIASVLYTALLPNPFWSKWAPPNSIEEGDRKEDYNIMNFPQSIAATFNLFVIIILFYLLFNKSLRAGVKSRLTKPLLYNMLVGCIYLYIQSAVVADRRLMAYYVIFYIFAFIIYELMTKEQRKHLFSLFFISFIALQLLGTAMTLR